MFTLGGLTSQEALKLACLSANMTTGEAIDTVLVEGYGGNAQLWKEHTRVRCSRSMLAHHLTHLHKSKNEARLHVYYKHLNWSGCRWCQVSIVQAVDKTGSAQAGGHTASCDLRMPVQLACDCTIWLKSLLPVIMSRHSIMICTIEVLC